jgi:hypothetical protein
MLLWAFAGIGAAAFLPSSVMPPETDLLFCYPCHSPMPFIAAIPFRDVMIHFETFRAVRKMTPIGRAYIGSLKETLSGNLSTTAHLSSTSSWHDGNVLGLIFLLAA